MMSKINPRRVLPKAPTSLFGGGVGPRPVVAAEVSRADLDQAGALVLAKRIRGSLDQARRDLLEFKERKGWKALGYRTWGECVEAEFEQSRAQVYRLLEAAQTDRDLSPLGDKAVGLPERVIRPLAGMDPEEKRAVMGEVHAENPGFRPTAKQVKGVEERRRSGEPHPKPPGPRASDVAPAHGDLEEVTLNVRAPGPKLPLASHRRAVEHAVAQGTGCVLMLTADQAVELMGVLSGLEGPKP